MTTNPVRAQAEAAQLSAAEERAATEFVHHELRLLDGRRFEAWIDLFTEDGYYWSPVKPDQLNPQSHVSLFFDDKKTMATRLNRLRHPRIHLQTPPSRTVHLVSNFQHKIDGRHTVTMCNFIMLEYRQTKGQRVYAGTYEYHLAPEAAGASYKIKMKKATLVNSDDSFPSLAVWF